LPVAKSFCFLSQSRRLFLSPSYLLSAEELLGEMSSRRCAIRRRHFPRQTLPQKLSLLTQKSLHQATDNKDGSDGAVTKKILQKDRDFAV